MAITIELDSNESTALLRSHNLGRVAYIIDEQPAILPVNYVFHSGMIVFRTDPGEKLDEIPMRRVAFEIDGTKDNEAWSLLVRGHARDITTAFGEPYDDLRSIPIPIQAPGAKEHWVAIEVIDITGRVIH